MQCSIALQVWDKLRMITSCPRTLRNSSILFWTFLCHNFIVLCVEKRCENGLQSVSSLANLPVGAVRHLIQYKRLLTNVSDSDGHRELMISVKLVYAQDIAPLGPQNITSQSYLERLGIQRNLRPLWPWESADHARVRPLKPS